MTEEKIQEEAVPITEDTRVDEFARDMFRGMGYTTLSTAMVNIHNAFKRQKDKLFPGKLSPEGFAFIATLADMSDGKIDLGGDQTNDEPEE